MRLRALLLAAAIALPAAPALAESAAAARAAVPAQLTADQRTAYREIFAAIRAEDWAGAAAKLDALAEGPLHAAARAELYLAKNSPKVELQPLLALLEKAPELPGAEQLSRLATTRGATALPVLPQAQPLIWQGGQPRRARAQSGSKNDPLAAELDQLVQPLIVADRPAEAEALLREREVMLAPQARTEFLQRIGWAHYLIGNSADARRLSDEARQGSGEFVLHAAWTSGLAAWRMKDCKAAAEAFATVGGRATDVELAAAGHYWASRADMICGRPERVQSQLRSAARLKETFYGMLAATALGIRTPNYVGLHDYRDAEWRGIATKPNVRTAIALAEIGETNLADSFIRHQARIGGPSDHHALLHLAADLNLASTQFWLAHNAPRGTSVNLGARYPRPDWSPTRGWRVDQALVFGHALQESNFRTQVVSPAGAQGLLQVRPGTAGDIARSRGQAFSRDELGQPGPNLEYGQSYIEFLRDRAETGGLLPKVIAAYNAGPKPIGEWNFRATDQSDPLLYIESIPYWETRGYVPIVLRNYWVYDQANGKSSPSRHALAQGLWPKFPGMAGAAGVRLQGNRELASGAD
ncbi:lytic transglycosylase domain-containing protein [Sphingomonas parva]|uniref:Lytic transglycosylase domain-containing protein n=1 Tax=Sphingomonas parva TaxID=2555898 RepID=A0A4Y8ZUW2_9SPHN|nr:lytic transglycosylase domain-containing protein [Sphingomonas parva]TFI59267.1 lytic transglycosylase domain-containing protein [Sphingomonas parva]